MPALERIAYNRLANYEDLDVMLLKLRDQGKLTTSQYISAKTILSKYIPTTMKVFQRLPKSVTYFETAQNDRIKMTNRAKVYNQSSVVVR